MVKKLFISHSWGLDSHNRDNHQRCIELYKKLQNKNYSVWIDDKEIYGNIDSSIMKGINNCKVVLICLTENYCKKINNAVINNLPNDNCYKEWNYSLFKQKIIIPVIMDSKMKNIYLKEDGIVQMYFNSTLYIDASSDLDHAVDKIIFTLKNKNIYSDRFVNKFQKIKRLDNFFKYNNFKTQIFKEQIKVDITNQLRKEIKNDLKNLLKNELFDSSSNSNSSDTQSECESPKILTKQSKFPKTIINI